MAHKTITCIVAFVALYFNGLYAQDVYRNPETDVRLLKKFQDAKLGMFVHWMVCYTPETGDSWSIGDPTPKRVADSISFAWNPSNFNAKKIVGTAKRLGCKYMVVISKHHDGFAIWPTQYSNFNVTRTAFKKDILKELGQECKRQGLLFGIYYSIADIDYCGWAKMAEARAKIQTPAKGEDDFVQFNKNQVKELITNYNPDILWFDGFWLGPDVWNPRMGKELYDYIKSLKWSTLSTRLSVTYDPKDPGKQSFVNDGSAGDFYAIEAKTSSAPNYPWEGCTSVSYPVYAYDPNAKLHTAEELITTFDKTICGNGNFLLNIGPKRTGELPQKLVDRFGDLTKWIQPNAKAVYNTKGGPFIQDKWGGSTYRGNNIFLHIRESDTLITLNLNGYRIKNIHDIQTNQTIAFEKLQDGRYVVHIPPYPKERMIPVLEIVLDRPYVFEEWVSMGGQVRP